jgi:hypothetical protein
MVFLGLVGPGIESESIRVFPAGAKESDSLFFDFSRIVPTLGDRKKLFSCDVSPGFFAVSSSTSTLFIRIA